MAKEKRIIYWDTCVFLAWMFDERNEPAIIDGIEEIVKQVDENKITLITSVVTRTEILEGRMDDEAQPDGCIIRQAATPWYGEIIS